MSLQISYHICYLALPRPAFHLAAPPQPHSQRLPPLLAGSAAAPQRAAAAAIPPLQSMPSWPGTRRRAAIGTTTQLCGVRTALLRPAFLLAARPQPHSWRLPTVLAVSAAAPQRAAAATPPFQSTPPWPGTRRPAATGTTARLCGVRTALPRPAFHLAASPQPHSRRLADPARG